VSLWVKGLRVQRYLMLFVIGSYATQELRLPQAHAGNDRAEC